MTLLAKKLAKLTITAFRDRELKIRIGSLVADHNPETLSLGYAAEYETGRLIDTTATESGFRGFAPTALGLELRFLDNPNALSRSVDQKLLDLRLLCGVLDKQTREPRFLKVSWGRLSWNSHGYFVGRLTSLNVHYDLFDRDGAPLRASAQLELRADESGATTANGASAGLGAAQSDVDHITTSALANGGSEGRYLDLAMANELDHADGALPDGELTIPKSWRAL